MSEDMELSLSLEGTDASDIPPWEMQEEMGVSSSDETLEIYRKAENFKKLKLTSGARIDKPLKQYIQEHYGKQGLQRYAFATYIMKALNFIPSDDVLLLLSSTKHARAVIATAGAGKTTSLQLDLIVSKLMDAALGCYHLDPVRVGDTDVTMPAILYLNYNKHNVQPILERYKGLCGRVNSVIQETISDELESSTVHSFCHRWLQSFAFDVTLPELSIIDDTKKETLWKAVAQPRWLKYYQEETLGVDWEVLDALYQYKTESMLDWDEFFLAAKFVDTGLNPDFTKACLKKYESMKRQMKLMDFTDYLIFMIETLRQYPELKQRVQSRYKIIVADENQDFTRLMNELLIEIYNPELNSLIVVGDPDQTIYQFKGVSPDNVVDLSQRLKDVELLGLDTNYRCPDVIVDAAKRILDMNILRFDKPIKTVKTGGRIIPHGLDNAPDQVSAVLGVINGMTEEQRGRTVLTYRNNKSSLIIGEELYYANIPFSVLDDKRPFNNMVFKHIMTALSALQEKDNQELNKSLFRFLPVSKDLWARVLEANAKHRHMHLHDLIIPDDMPNGTGYAIGILVDISMRVDTAPCSDYMGTLFGLYRKYFFDYLMKNPNPSLGDEDLYSLWLERSMKFWLRPYTFDYMRQELQERNIDRAGAITFSTFHGLKGLEFDYVLAIDFNDNIFPNFFQIEQKYPPNTAKEEEESENRLCYVLVTRAIKELHLFYLKSNPSYYLEKLVPRAEGATGDVHNLNLGSVMLPGDALSAKMQFIQKLTRGRG